MGSGWHGKLTDTEAKLPIAAVWTHRFVFEMVLQGWRPEHAGRGMRDASSAPPPVVSRPAPEAIRVANVVDHYLYLPRKQDAATVAVALRAKGFKTEEARAADDSAWLVRAAHEIIPSEEILDGVRTMMEALVEPFGGEYDGWEASN